METIINGESLKSITLNQNYKLDQIKRFKNVNDYFPS